MTFCWASSSSRQHGGGSDGHRRLALAWLAVLLPGKALTTALAAAVMRWPAHVGVRIAVILAHDGEFGLLLLTQAIGAGIVAADLGQPALFALTPTMGIVPVLIQRNASISQFIGSASQRIADTEEDAVRHEGERLEDHVLLCECGRVGRLVATTLEAAQVPYMAVESDLERFREARRRGHKVVLGDASRRRILDAAGLARALARCDIRPSPSGRPASSLCDHRDPSLPSLVSAADDRNVSELANAGASTVFPENLAAGLALADQALLLSGLTRENAAQIITTVRTELNQDLRGRVGL